MEREVIAVVQASPLRRGIGVGMLYALGAMLLYLDFMQPPQHLGWQAFLLVCGLGAIALAEAMRRATASRIELTRAGLHDAQGRLVARLSEIEAVDRGAFAFKPTNGFLLTTSREQGPRVWAPGLWWRFGRRVGIGGVTPAGQGRFMAEMIVELLAEENRPQK